MDQATTLREMAQPFGAERHLSESRRPRVIAITSGKGGVGKTNVVANLAIALSDLRSRVTILDADFGLANIDVLLGLTPKYHLGHVLFGEKELSDIIIEGPHGVRIIPASSGIQELSELTPAQRRDLVSKLSALDYDTDFLLIDTAAGISNNVMHFLTASDEVIVITTPEPTAIVDAYAMIKVIHGETPDKVIKLIVNSTQTAKDASQVMEQINLVARQFLNREVQYLGAIDKDAAVAKAVMRQSPVLDVYPDAPASRCLRMLARRIKNSSPADPESDMTMTAFWKTLFIGDN